MTAFAAALALLLETLTGTTPACASPSPRLESGAVLCCCATMNGGQCCATVIFCGGFVPGCFCSPGTRPVGPQTA